MSSAWLIVACLFSAEASAPSGAARSADIRAASDQRDVLVLLDDGPLHMRLRLQLGGQSLSHARQEYVTRLMRSVDADGDGKVSRAEAARSPILRTRQRPGVAALGFTGAEKTPRDVLREVDRIGGELVAYRQDLSSAMNDLEVFKLLDADESGLLDSQEMTAAAEFILAKDGDGDECVSFQEFFPPPPPPDPMQVALVQPDATPPPIATVADMIRDTKEPLLPRRLIKKYDRNRDLQLEAQEIGWTADRLAVIDANKNGKLDAKELGAIGQMRPDLELVVDMKAPDQDGGTISVADASGTRLDDNSRGDYVKLSFAPAVVSFSHRNLDPIAAAVKDAMQQFNLLDADANGYLDKDETSGRGRFERGLFDLLDADGDEKIFAEEMKEYVQARAEPAASACQVYVYDTGYGFFMALDANADGRVSVREMRDASKSLAQLDRDGRPGVNMNEPVRHFHVEFVRRSFKLFGASEELVAQAPAFQQRKPTGPIWFQRMDRNNDGDVTWSEFLGPREVFHKLDGDNDSLIDPQEAVKAK
jgi:Ca2+-binding EF-hand superfamily protein